jgi:uncharacterized protein YkwD
MSRSTPHRPPAAARPCAPSSTLLLALALGLCAGVPGCYTGPIDTPPGAPWDEGGDAEDDASEAPADDAGESEGGGTAGGDAGEAGEADGADEVGGSDSGDAGDADAGDADAGDADAGDAGDAGESSDSGEPPPPASDDVPDIAYCEDVAVWDPAWVQLELDILDLVNQRRAEGANCGSEGSFGAAPPLTMHPALRCAARKHSKDMHERSFFDHTNPSGESPWDRMGQAGYTYSSAGENIAGGSPDAAGTMQQWMGSDGHCANIMSPNFEEIGVGYYPGGEWGTLWTQAFGAQ